MKNMKVKKYHDFVNITLNYDSSFFLEIILAFFIAFNTRSMLNLELMLMNLPLVLILTYWWTGAVMIFNFR